MSHTTLWIIQNNSLLVSEPSSAILYMQVDLYTIVYMDHDHDYTPGKIMQCQYINIIIHSQSLVYKTLKSDNK